MSLPTPSQQTSPLSSQLPVVSVDLRNQQQSKQYQQSVPKPLFLTTKYAILPLQLNIFDFQLRDHYRKVNDLYCRTCECSNHLHKKQKCVLTSKPSCPRCGAATSVYLPYYVDLFHRDVLALGANQELSLFRCTKQHYHTHTPPCEECIGCKTNSVCVVPGPIECVYATTSVCQQHSRFALNYNEFVYEHLMENNSLFYICSRHAHIHWRNSVHRAVSRRRKTDRELVELESTYDRALCYVQLNKCCDEAVLINDYTHSFLITQTSDYVDGPINKSANSYTIYNPALWKDHAKSQFVSLIKAVLLYPELVADRYSKFEESNYKVGNINKYKSGNHSGVRIKITGFDAKSAFQTSTISSRLKRQYTVLPVNLYESLESDFDLDFGLVIRHPGINYTCLYVQKILKHRDPSVQTITINHHIAKGLNQDQDGDKNIIFFLPRYRGTFAEKLARYEISDAFDREQTLLCENRYSFSENSRLLIYRNASWLQERSSFFRKTYALGLAYMLDAGHGYLRDEYSKFCDLVDELNERNVYAVTFDDLCGTTNLIDSIVASEAKGHQESVRVFRDKLFHTSSQFSDECHRQDSNKQMNRYIKSSVEVRNIGRESFILINGQQDLKIAAGVVTLNNINYADLKPSAGFLTFLQNYASFDQYTKDLLDAVRSYAVTSSCMEMRHSDNENTSGSTDKQKRQKQHRLNSDSIFTPADLLDVPAIARAVDKFIRCYNTAISVAAPNYM